MTTPPTIDPSYPLPPENGWGERRLRYNVSLVAAIVAAGLSYVLIVAHFNDVIGRPIVDGAGRVVGHEPVELAGVEGMAQCCGVVIAVGLANVFYLLGAGVERLVPPARVDAYRRWAWRAGVLISCALPRSAPLLHLTCCLFFPAAYDHTPIRPGGW